MAFRKVTPLEKVEEPRLLQGAPPKVSFVDADPIVINFDFVTMISQPDPPKELKESLPTDCAVLVLHDGSSMAVRGNVAHWIRLLK